VYLLNRSLYRVRTKAVISSAAFLAFSGVSPKPFISINSSFSASLISNEEFVDCLIILVVVFIFSTTEP